MKRIISLLFSTVCISAADAQEIGYSTFDAGAEFQWYPRGTITGLHLAYNSKIHHAVNLRIGYNKTDHKDDGKHSEEKGSGWGGTIGYRYYINPFPHKFFIGPRTDLWRMKIDWADINPVASGTSKVWVLQPTLEIGYLFLINDQAFITPTIANGYEFNIKTEGAETGKGFITLLGISAGFRF